MRAETDNEISSLVERANLTQQLIERGVCVVKSAGNEGRGSIDLDAILVPDLIIAGAEASPGKPDEFTSSRPFVDSFGPSEVSILLADGVMTVSGTSYSVPSAAQSVLTLRALGFTPPEINTILAEKARRRP